jgi:tetrachlorobenzoquinone reductase
VSEEVGAEVSGFTVELAKTGQTIHIKPGDSILDTLLLEGLSPLYSCQEGICGTCEVRVLAGEPEHRDHVLSPDEQASNQRMMICCSGSKSPRLVLDL